MTASSPGQFEVNESVILILKSGWSKMINSTSTTAVSEAKQSEYVIGFIANKIVSGLSEV